MNQRRIAQLVGALLLWCAAGSAAAQVTIRTSVLANGGQSASGSMHGLQGTVGQAAIGFSAGPARRHGAGFWYRGHGYVSAVGPDLPVAAITPFLGPGCPNPFNPRTTIAFATAAAGRVTLRVFDLAGREVRVLVDRELPAGAHTTVFDAPELPSGVYLYRLTAGSFSQVRKLALLK